MGAACGVGRIDREMDFLVGLDWIGLGLGSHCLYRIDADLVRCEKMWRGIAVFLHLLLLLLLLQTKRKKEPTTKRNNVQNPKTHTKDKYQNQNRKPQKEFKESYTKQINRDRPLKPDELTSFPILYRIAGFNLLDFQLAS